MAKIGIFGGSFNPPHLGHILAVREFHDRLALDCVFVIPAAVPPHKAFSQNSPEAAHRLKMTELAFCELPYVQVLDIELRRAGVSYTADTLELLRSRYPNDELYFLMGTDMFLSFETWYRPERIAAVATLVAAHREEDDSEALTACAAHLRQSLGAKTLFLDNSVLPLSSTSARAMLAFGCAEGGIAPQVMAYIRENHLYLTDAALKRLPFDRLAAVSLSLHKPSRIAHVVGCSETAERLAIRCGENAENAKRAGILHDITKALNADEQLTLCRKYDVPLNPFERENPKLLHAKTGAVVARHVFGENDAVYHAICWHTTGRADMSRLEKILYLADYIEPNRCFDGVDELRRRTEQSLDAGMLLGIRMTIAQLVSRGRQIDPNSLSALHFFEERIRNETIRQ